jgi:hypothetical protein
MGKASVLTLGQRGPGACQEVPMRVVISMCVP